MPDYTAVIGHFIWSKSLDLIPLNQNKIQLNFKWHLNYEHY